MANSKDGYGHNDNLKIVEISCHKKSSCFILKLLHIFIEDMTNVDYFTVEKLVATPKYSKIRYKSKVEVTE